MAPLEVVRTVVAALEEGDMKGAAARLADNFIVTGLVPEAMNKNEFLGLMRGLVNAMPDFAFNPTEETVQGETVRAKLHLQGTQTETLNLGAIGIPPLRATHLEVVLPEEPAEFIVRDDKLAVLRFLPIPGGGIMGLLEQLGIDLTTGERIPVKERI